MKTRIPAVLLLATVAVVYAVDSGSQGEALSTQKQTETPPATPEPVSEPVSAAALPVAQPLRETPIDGLPPAGKTELIVGEPTEVRAKALAIADPDRKEQIWTEISEAISGLNKLVGDDLFKGLERQSGSDMKVMVDPDYWSRVRYETRVELKTDISKIWHLYAQQYNDSTASSVFFIDAESGKTIDIYTLATQ